MLGTRSRIARAAHYLGDERIYTLRRYRFGSLNERRIAICNFGGEGMTSSDLLLTVGSPAEYRKGVSSSILKSIHDVDVEREGFFRDRDLTSCAQKLPPVSCRDSS